MSSLTRFSGIHLQAQELDSSATLRVDFRHVESTDAELSGLIQQHHYRIELGLRQVTAVPPTHQPLAACLATPSPLNVVWFAVTVGNSAVGL